MIDKIEKTFIFIFIIAAAYGFALGGENNPKKELKLCQEVPKK